MGPSWFTPLTFTDLLMQLYHLMEVLVPGHRKVLFLCGCSVTGRFHGLMSGDTTLGGLLVLSSLNFLSALLWSEMVIVSGCTK